MIRLPYLQPDDPVYITAPASPVKKADIVPAADIYTGWGLKVQFAKHLYASKDQFAGKDDDRLADFQSGLDNPGIKAIICARGGYGTIRILSKLNFDRFKSYPKWIVGFSDITLLHILLNNNMHFESLHGPMPININSDDKQKDMIENMKSLLFGKPVDYTFPSDTNNRQGTGIGQLIGGNLSILCSTMGTPYEPDTSGRILFIEDVDEYLYHIDRMMWTLKLAGKLSALRGLVIGAMNDMKDKRLPFGKSAYEIIAEAVADYDYPVAFGFPAGHISSNHPLIMGRRTELKVDEKGSNLIFKS